MGRHAANTSEQSTTCSSTWNTQIWDKQLHCKSHAVGLQCKALESLFGIFNKELLHVIQDFLNSVAKEAACGSDSVKCPKKVLSSQAPLTIVGKDPSLLSRFLQRSPSGDSLLRTFALISGNKWKDAKGLISGAGKAPRDDGNN
ncbi:hypothetical protein, conserved [Eimeria necatrix]|uniref:Uncharacterized protein n=1 Tax=Eimeria necatrix TaxID=51315 RepID=U6MPH2_9EIME|nr:hypothetical protein, conserved [Eimeria necatrix]CDJ64389.1 hypothetical protein, conserved [Eimeria necatrix]